MVRRDSIDFWFDIFGSVLLIPVVMIFSGRMTWRHYPKQINALMVYRTTRSTKNEDTWKFANQYSGHLYEKIGWTTMLASILVLLMLLRSSKTVISNVSTVICVLQCICLLLPILPTEKALKNHFKEDGTPREPENNSK